MRLVREFVSDGGQRVADLQQLAMMWAAGELTSMPSAKKFVGIQNLFTWNGSFGLLDKESLLGDAWPPVREVTRVIKMSETVLWLVKEINEFVDKLKLHKRLDKFAWAVELCEDTYERRRRLSRPPSDDRSEASSPEKSCPGRWSSTSDESRVAPCRVGRATACTCARLAALPRDGHPDTGKGFGIPQEPSGTNNGDRSVAEM